MPLAIATEVFARFERLAFLSRRPARAGLGGEHRSRPRASSTDFLDYRPYQPGDDFRSVDWNVYGRLGSLQVKVTEGRERLDVVLVLDCSSSMDWGEPHKLTFAANVVGALGHIALARADALRLVCLGAPPQAEARVTLRGRSSRSQLVDRLAALAPAGAVDIRTSLATCLPAGARQALVIVVSDLLHPAGIGESLDALAGHDVVVLHVLSPGELDPAASGELELEDVETGEVQEIGASLATLQAYRARLATWMDAQMDACLQRGMRYVRLRTDAPVTHVLLDDLRGAGVLK